VKIIPLLHVIEYGPSFSGPAFSGDPAVYVSVHVHELTRTKKRGISRQVIHRQL